MALRFIDSFDHYLDSVGGNEGQVTSKWTTNYNEYARLETAIGRCDTSGLVCTGNTGTVSKGIPGVSGASGVVGYAVSIQNVLTDTTILKIGNYAGFHFYLVWSKLDGSIYAYNPGGGGSVIGTPSAADAIRQYRYYYVECKYTIHATTGSIQVRINGDTSPVLDLTNINSQGGLASANWTFVGYDLPQNGTYYIDDVYVEDGTDGTATQGAAYNDYLGDCHVSRLRPTGNGATMDWDVTGAGGVAWTAVDDDTAWDGDTSYISTDVVDEDALFTFDDPAVPIDVVFAVQTNLVAVKEMPGVRTIAPLIRQGGTTVEGTSQNPSQEDYHDHHELFCKNPVTDTAWSTSDVAAGGFQSGARLTA